MSVSLGSAVSADSISESLLNWSASMSVSLGSAAIISGSTTSSGVVLVAGSAAVVSKFVFDSVAGSITSVSTFLLSSAVK